MFLPGKHNSEKLNFNDGLSENKEQANKYLICWPVFLFAQNGLIFWALLIDQLQYDKLCVTSVIN